MRAGLRGLELTTEFLVMPVSFREPPLPDAATVLAGRVGPRLVRERAVVGVPRLELDPSFWTALLVLLRLVRLGAMRPGVDAVLAARVVPELAPRVMRRVGSCFRFRPDRSSIFFRVARVSCRASWRSVGLASLLATLGR